MISVSLTYKNLKDINLELEEGKIYSLMGPNGSGKTTLLKCIFGLLNYTGNVSLDSKDMGINLGITNLRGDTAFNNIIEPLENLNIDSSKAHKKVYEISKKLGIEDLLYKDINSLSHSQKIIVSCARSIIHEPKLILLDGIFDSLNKDYKTKIISYLNHLKKSKKCTIIFTTNNSEDLSICDNLIILNNGKIVADESVKELLNDEKLLTKNNIKLPFLIDLSHKLISYNLIDNVVDDYDEMVDLIWK